jgi:hypothetical protein
VGAVSCWMVKRQAGQSTSKALKSDRVQVQLCKVEMLVLSFAKAVVSGR